MNSYEDAEQEGEPIMDVDAGVWGTRVLREVLGYVIPETKDFFECEMTRYRLRGYGEGDGH